MNGQTNSPKKTILLGILLLFGALIFLTIIYWSLAGFVKASIRRGMTLSFLNNTNYSIEGTDEYISEPSKDPIYTFGGLNFPVPLGEIGYAFPYNISADVGHRGVDIVFRNGMTLVIVPSSDWRPMSANHYQGLGPIRNWKTACVRFLMPATRSAYEWTEIIWQTKPQDITASSSLLQDFKTFARLESKAIMLPAKVNPHLRRFHTRYILGHTHEVENTAVPGQKGLICEFSQPDGPWCASMVIKYPDRRIMSEVLGNLRFAFTEKGGAEKLTPIKTETPTTLKNKETSKLMSAIEQLVNLPFDKTASMQLFDLYHQAKWIRAGKVWTKEVLPLLPPEQKAEIARRYPEFIQERGQK